jgi:hypothetical protein
MRVRFMGPPHGLDLRVDQGRGYRINAVLALIVALLAIGLGPLLPRSALPGVVVVNLVFCVAAVVFWALSRPSRDQVSSSYWGRFSPRQQSAIIWGAVGAIFVVATLVPLIKHR